MTHQHDDETEDEDCENISLRRNSQIVRPRKRRSGWTDENGVPDRRSPSPEPTGFTAETAPSKLLLVAQQMNLSPDLIKAAKELFVGNLPPQMEVNQLIDFVNAALMALKGNILPGVPCLQGGRAPEGPFAYLEFRTMEEANNALALNGISWGGYSLKIGRPKTYPEALLSVPAAQQGTMPTTCGVTNGILTGVSIGTPVNAEVLGGAFHELNSRLSGAIITSVGAVTPPPDALCLRNLPPPSILSDDRARELLTAFGSLKFFLHFGLPHEDIIEQKYKEYEKVADDQSESEPRIFEKFADDLLSQPADRSICLFEYHNPLDSQNLTDECVKLKLGGLRPTLLAAEIPLSEHPFIRIMFLRLIHLRCKSAISSMPMMVPTRCLFFINVVTVEDLIDDAEYADILDDVKVECRKCGRLISMEIPRPLNGEMILDRDGGEGFVFVEFATVEEACRARRSLNGRRFSGRIIRAEFLSEIKYSKRDFRGVTYNTLQEASTTYNESLSLHVPAMIKQMEELERVGREAARAAATAAANASFTGSILEMPAMANLTALIDVPKPSFDEDVDREDEAMEEEDD